MKLHVSVLVYLSCYPITGVFNMRAEGLHYWQSLIFPQKQFMGQERN